MTLWKRRHLGCVFYSLSVRYVWRERERVKYRLCSKQLFAQTIQTIYGWLSLSQIPKQAQNRKEKEIEEKRQFFIEEEKKLVQATNAEILEDGSIKFPTIEDQIKFSQEHAVMLSCELEDMPVIELSFDDLGDEEFSAKEVMALAGVINLVD